VDTIRSSGEFAPVFGDARDRCDQRQLICSIWFATGLLDSAHVRNRSVPYIAPGMSGVSRKEIAAIIRQETGPRDGPLTGPVQS